MKNTNRFNVKACGWKHHLEDGGWEWVCSHITKHFHSSKSEILMYTAYEYQVREKIFHPHIAWFHQVINGYKRSLTNIVKSDFWENNRKKLVHALTVSKNQENFLRDHGVEKITTILHPTPLNVPKWDKNKFCLDKKIYHVGFHLRNIKAFEELAHEARKLFEFCYLVPKNDITIDPQTLPSVKIIPRVNAGEYNRILTSAVVFFDLVDTTANNTILECIARGTPVLVNPIGGVRDYLGAKYPLYYRSNKEILTLVKMISEGRILSEAHEYLLSIRERFSIDKFISKLKKTLN